MLLHDDGVLLIPPMQISHSFDLDKVCWAANDERASFDIIGACLSMEVIILDRTNKNYDKNIT